MSAAAGPDIIEDGLVLCLDAGNRDSYPGSGTVWTDLAGTNNGTLTNGPTFNSANGGSIVFDGGNDNINCSQFELNTPSLTYVTWFRPITVTGSTRTLIAKELSCKYRINTNAGIDILFSYTGTGWSGSVTTSNNLLTANIWYNATLTAAANSSIILYINGVRIASSTLTNNLASNTNKIIIGSYASNGPEPFNGLISFVQVYNRALTPAEVLQNYNATKSRFLL